MRALVRKVWSRLRRRVRRISGRIRGLRRQRPKPVYDNLNYYVSDDGKVMTPFGYWSLPPDAMEHFPKRYVMWRDGAVTPNGRAPANDVALCYIQDEVLRHQIDFATGGRFKPRTFHEWWKDHN